MSKWTKRERVEAVLRGELADRPPISAWRHFPSMEHGGAGMLAEAMLEWERTYDWDYLKINPRAVYYHEAWGNEYDYDHYNDVVPIRTKQVVEKPADLEKITILAGNKGVFAEQIEAVAQIVKGVNGEVPVFQSIFTPIGILLNLCGMRSVGRYRESPREGSPVIQMIHENGELVHRAMNAIALTMADYCENLKNTGCDGLFYAALGMARTGYFTKDEWEEFVKPYDLIVLEAAKPLKTIVHTCGIYSNPEWFTDWPIDVIHWASSATGNPTIENSSSWLHGKIAMGGVDERPFGQDQATEIARLSRQVIGNMKKQPFLMAPDCSISTKTLDSEVRAFRESVEE
ncbi:MAG: uroporphyrinogen decarboxylase family protein [Lachnospiraceae bacterium]